MKLDRPPIKIHTLSGGKMPERKTEGAIGFDCYLRAIVSASEMDPDNPKLRKTIFDFTDSGLPENKKVQHFLEKDDDGEWLYRLEPRKQVLVGIGFATEMEFPYFYWVAPRSGLSSRHGITIMNTPGTVDPDYRGEAGVVLVNNSNKSFYLHKDMRIAQIIFTQASIPELVEIDKYSDLDSTERGSGGFGSTGLK